MESSTVSDVPSKPEQDSRSNRADLSVYRHPFRTLYYFLYWCITTLKRGTAWFLRHPLTVFLLTPALLVYIGLKKSGAMGELVHEIDMWAKFIVWWIGLGFLSSVGFGSGMHSGLLFLFPHILKVCLAAEACQHVDFDARIDVWYNSEPFHCGESKTGQISAVGFWDIYRKVVVAGMLWGAGTALGEIPPYYVSYAATQTGQENQALLELEEDLKSRNLLKKVFAWMLYGMLLVIKRLGFYGVLLMASWPNAAFDLCGIVCGYFKMSFWNFFGATLIGKGVVKINGQLLVLVTLFQQQYREAVLNGLEGLLPQQPIRIGPLSLDKSITSKLHQAVNQQIIKFEDKVKTTSEAHRADETWWWEDARLMLDVRSGFWNLDKLAGWAKNLVPSDLKDCWDWLVFLAVLMFLMSVVNNLAYLGYIERSKQKKD